MVGKIAPHHTIFEAEISRLFSVESFKKMSNIVDRKLRRDIAIHASPRAKARQKLIYFHHFNCDVKISDVFSFD